MNVRAPVVAALLTVTCTGPAPGQATGLPVQHRWIFDGAAFALDLGYDANHPDNDQISVIAVTAGLAPKPFALTATLAHSDSAHGFSGGISAAIVARPNDWSALGAAQVDAGPAPPARRQRFLLPQRPDPPGRAVEAGGGLPPERGGGGRASGGATPLPPAGLVARARPAARCLQAGLAWTVRDAETGELRQ